MIRKGAADMRGNNSGNMSRSVSATRLAGSAAARVLFSVRVRPERTTSHELDAMIPVSYDEAVSQDEVDRETAAAIDFLKQFTQGKCVILTQVPTVGTKIGDANAVAAALGMKLITPEIADGLQTVDGSHLDGPSAERWSQAFFEAAGPEIRSCIDKHRAAAS